LNEENLFNVLPDSPEISALAYHNLLRMWTEV